MVIIMLSYYHHFQDNFIISITISKIFFFFFVAYSYEGSVASWTSCLQYSLFFAFLRAVWKPMLRGFKSFSTVHFHVELGLPFGRFHDHGISAWSARDMLWRSSIQATWPNEVRQCLDTILFNGCWEVWHRISTLVIWSDQQTPQKRIKHHWSHASILSLSDWVTV